jgi:hypothetical protein
MRTLFSIALILLTPPNLPAASVIVNWSIASDPVRQLLDNSGDPLSAGTSANGDGTLLQLGYYDMATMANPFSGAWVSIATTTMGDDGVDLNGKFAVTSILGSGSFLEPAIGMPLAIRFYDGASMEVSSYFNAVSVTNGAWNFKSPSDPAAVMNLVIDKGSATVFEGGSFSDFKTTRPIPEPSSLWLFSLGALALLRRHRSKNS